MNNVGRNKDIMGRAIKLVLMFQGRTGITTRDVQNKLGISKSGAQNWIRELSLHLPVYESGTRRVSKTGPEATVYELLK